ncbi:MAG: flagellar hook protein FlgE [Clostridia bacterium]|nr:flagellar hook protein FlgE [Clostridia bacterium]
MMSALFTGVSAMSSNQTKIDVISNNIANANTVGYKYQTVSFADSLSQKISGATAPTSTSGGSNAMQVGLGVGVASVNTVTTVGSFQYTGASTDLAISGDGYFIVDDGEGGYNFTRAGNFGVDSDGNLVTADGYLVCGWQNITTNTDGTYDVETTEDPQPLNIYYGTESSSKTIAPSATTEVVLTGNLNASDEEKGTAMDDIGTGIDDGESADYVLPMTTTDTLGAEHDVNIEYYKSYTETNADGDEETSYYWRAVAEDDTVLSEGYIKFDESGKIITDDTDFPTTAEVTMDVNVAGAGDYTFEMDFSSLTMYGSDSSVSTQSVDGNTAGTLLEFSIDSNGVITGTYSNGQQQALGVISLANFSNPAGLEKTGSNLYAETANSGEFSVAYAPGDGGTGTLSVGTLEMSNVDLSNEYSELILAQRGYQASSSIISTVDEMLQILMSLKS